MLLTRLEYQIETKNLSLDLSTLICLDLYFLCFCFDCHIFPFLIYSEVIVNYQKYKFSYKNLTCICEVSSYETTENLQPITNTHDILFYTAEK
jgi:hypothetical protein